MKNYKILYVNSTDEIGGAEVSLVNLLKKLDKNRFLTAVALPSRGPLAERAIALGVKTFIKPLMQFSRKNWFSFLFSTFKLAFLIRKEKAQLVHANSIYISEQSLFAARLAGIPCICHVRDLAPVLGAGKIRTAAFKRMRKFIVISEAVKKDLIEKLYIPENKVVRIYNGVDTHEFSPDISGDNFRNEFNLGTKKLIGVIGRLSPEKGQEIFLHAATQVLKDHQDVGFIIVGDDKLGSNKFKEDIAVLTAKLGLQDKVIFTGFRRDLPQVMAALDIVVVPSLAEPFGRVVIEAMAMQKPLVAAAAGGVPEIVTEKCAILFEPGNTQQLKDGIAELLKDRELSMSMGEEGRKIVLEKFNLDRHILEIEKLYEEILR